MIGSISHSYRSLHSGLPIELYNIFRKKYIVFEGKIKLCSRCESPLERKFHEAWLKHPASKELKVEPQYVIDQHRLDFALVHHQIGIEVDSKEYHSSSEAKQKDQERDNILRSKGWKLIHLYGPDIHWHPNSSVEITVFMIQNMFDQFVPSRKLIPNGSDIVQVKKTESIAIDVAMFSVILAILLLPIFAFESLTGNQLIHSALEEKYGIIILFFYLTLPFWFRAIYWLMTPIKKGDK